MNVRLHKRFRDTFFQERQFFWLFIVAFYCYDYSVMVFFGSYLLFSGEVIMCQGEFCFLPELVMLD